MKIEVIPDKADQAGLEMLELSRMLRQAREEVEEVRRQLRRHSQLEECRYALQKQEDALTRTTANCVKLSCSLREIVQVYRRTEQKNIACIEEQPPAHRGKEEIIIFGSGYGLNQTVQTILYQ
ncbi:hypothetical protein D1646_00840 [Pseudoflavonifractor sp. 60]|uniref:hypothetical protein n=1 Tax=Pseudoflavonifractor sp. 60 TaxID=2304576 RepID=UPI00137030BE|nr:hypothetical protein [Pseudoflavonifractor sp. 60]NBI65375.1 hypothetical protein [Pseudoflavonifractor sp. 60]